MFENLVEFFQVCDHVRAKGWKSEHAKDLMKTITGLLDASPAVAVADRERLNMIQVQLGNLPDSPPLRAS